MDRPRAHSSLGQLSWRASCLRCPVRSRGRLWHRLHGRAGRTPPNVGSQAIRPAAQPHALSLGNVSIRRLKSLCARAEVDPERAHQPVKATRVYQRVMRTEKSTPLAVAAAGPLARARGTRGPEPGSELRPLRAARMRRSEPPRLRATDQVAAGVLAERARLEAGNVIELRMSRLMDFFDIHWLSQRRPRSDELGPPQHRPRDRTRSRRGAPMADGDPAGECRRRRSPDRHHAGPEHP